MSSIFVSYRRDDSRHQTGRLHDRLSDHFGKARVFKDVDSIPIGSDFREILNQRVAACDVLLAIIGDDWLSVGGPTGNRRLDDPADFVRIEIEAALSRKIPVIPVLVGKVEMPRAEDLPESLRDLAYRHAIQVRPDPDFHADATRLIRGIETRIEELRKRRTAKPARARRKPPIRLSIALVVAFLAVLLGIFYVLTDKGRVKIWDDDPNIVVSVHGQQARIPKPEPKQVKPPPDIPKKPVEMPRPVVQIKPSVDQTLITNTIGMKLKLIPAGEFLMGSDASDSDASDDEKVNGKKHRVRITKPFYLGTTEVTVGQFRRFVEKTNFKTDAEKDVQGGYGWNDARKIFEQDPKYTWRSPGFAQTDFHPVTNVSWNDAVAFCDWLSQEEGQTYRLPTEAEWEYSCRAGQATRYSSGDDPETLATVGNVVDATAREKFPHWTWSIKARDGHVFTAPVGQFQPNAFGLYDMHGNVWEWCQDWDDAGYYAKSPEADPQNLAQAAIRVRRGGCWNNDPQTCRSAFRFSYTPSFSYTLGSWNHDLGFRVARVRSSK